LISVRSSTDRCALIKLREENIERQSAPGQFVSRVLPVSCQRWLLPEGRGWTRIEFCLAIGAGGAEPDCGKAQGQRGFGTRAKERRAHVSSTFGSVQARSGIHIVTRLRQKFARLSVPPNSVRKLVESTMTISPGRLL